MNAGHSNFAQLEIITMERFRERRLWLSTAVGCASHEWLVQDLRTFAAPRMNWHRADFAVNIARGEQ
jgi:hypothetical protein